MSENGSFATVIIAKFPHSIDRYEVEELVLVLILENRLPQMTNNESAHDFS
jgi:hypothetical protein